MLIEGADAHGGERRRMDELRPHFLAATILLALITAAPTTVRAVRYRYTFAPPGADGVWQRERLGPYCRGVAVRDPPPPE